MDWVWLIEQRLSDTTLPVADLSRRAEALAHLRLVFGEHLQLVPEVVHRNLFNFAPWTHQWLNWLSDALVRLSSVGGYSSLQRRLIDPNRFIESYSVLQVAERLNAIELDVEFDVPVSIGRSRKIPDLYVADQGTGIAFCIEISNLFLSERQTASAHAVETIFKALLAVHAPVVYAVRITGPIDNVAIHDAALRLQHAARQAAKPGAFREIHIPNALEAAVGHPSQLAAVAAWGMPRGLSPGVIAGHPPSGDLTLRFERKVARKIKQLPAGVPNVLVIPAMELFFSAGGLKRLLKCVRTAIAEHPQIALAVISSEESAWAQSSAETIEDSRLLTSYRLGVKEQFLVVPNSSGAVAHPESLREKIFSAFAL